MDDPVEDILFRIRTGEYRLISWVDDHEVHRDVSRYFLERKEVGPDGRSRWARCPGTAEFLRLASHRLQGRFSAREGITIYR